MLNGRLACVAYEQTECQEKKGKEELVERLRQLQKTKRSVLAHNCTSNSSSACMNLALIGRLLRFYASYMVGVMHVPHQWPHQREKATQEQKKCYKIKHFGAKTLVISFKSVPFINIFKLEKKLSARSQYSKIFNTQLGVNLTYPVMRTAVSWWLGCESSGSFWVNCHWQKFLRQVWAFLATSGPFWQ